MKSYTINDVELLTGIKAHTLRVWEKRYQSLIPHRTDTNIRYYDDGQMRKLLNVSSLLQQGYKTSTLMNMEEAEMNQLILESSNKVISNDIYHIHINNLISSMITFDEFMFDRVFSTILIRYGLYDAMINIIFPFLIKTGILWSVNNVIPAQEHFASNIIKRKLLAAIDGIPFPKIKSKKFILFLPPDEWHELGLLFAEYIIRNAGLETIYLGQNVPIENLHQIIEKTHPQYLLSFVVIGTDFREHLKYFTQLVTENIDVNLLVCGNFPDNLTEIPNNMIFLKKPELIFDFLK